jgi:hypothetical protein
MIPGMTRSRRSVLGSTLAALALALLSPASVDAQYRELCTSVPSQCTHTGPDAPQLQANVCFGSTIGIRLMSGGSCPSGSWPYYVSHGEVVDPITNQVAAYIPLDDACARPGICVQGPPPAGAQEYPMCCTKGSSGVETCSDDMLCGGTLWWCVDGVCNEDGTITCFEKES